MNWDAIGSIATVGGTILALLMAYQAFKQLSYGANNSKGEFILNLQQVYVDNSAYADLFEACWKNYSDPLKLSDDDLMEYLKKHDKDVLNYLTFFESIFLMTDCNVLDMKLLDELFGRRFFIVVNNRCVQKFDLVRNKPYYENVFFLYDKWKKYRIDSIRKKEKKNIIKYAFDKEYKEKYEDGIKEKIQKALFLYEEDSDKRNEKYADLAEAAKEASK